MTARTGNPNGRPRIPEPYRQFAKVCVRMRLAKQHEVAKFLGISRATVSRIVGYE